MSRSRWVTRWIANGLYPPKEAAEHLGCSLRTLEVWRVQRATSADGKELGPAFIKIKTRVLYRRADLDAFLAGKLTAKGT